MICQIVRNTKGNVEQVLAPNGEKSLLYSHISQDLQLGPEESLHVWAKSYTPVFTSQYKGEMDKNGEPVYAQAKDLLRDVTDLVLHEGKNQGKLLEVAKLFNMSATGFMGPQVNPEAVRIEMKKRGVTGTTVVQTSNKGGYFLKRDGKKYNPFDPPRFQLTQDKLPPDAELDNIIRRFLGKIGVAEENVMSLPYDATARVDLVNRVIEVVEGKAGRDTLTEEAVHVAVALMRGSTEYDIMRRAVRQMDIYEQVKQEYSDVDEYSDRDIDEEAIVKTVTSEVLKEYDRRVSENSRAVSAEERTEKEGLRQTLNAWWDFILKYLRGLFKGAPVSEFRKLANAVLQAEVADISRNYDGSPESIYEGTTWEEAQSVYYQITPAPEKAKKIDDWIKEMNDLKFTQRGNRYYSETLKKDVRMRVSDRSSRYAAFLYGSAEFTPEYKRLYTTKGTIIHAYNQLIAQHLIQEFESGNKNDIEIEQRVVENQVYALLKDHADFQGFDKNYYKINRKGWNSLLKGVAHLLSSIYEFDGNAKIYPEQVIYDPREADNDIAGTVDLLVRYSDGTIGIYDYKSMQMHWDRGLKSYAEVDQKKRQTFDMQLSDYKKILTKGMELSDKDFREIRVVPINVQFGRKEGSSLEEAEFKVVEMGHPGVNKAYMTYLSQISVGRELVPEDRDLNTFLKGLYNERSNLIVQERNTRGDEKVRLKAKINKMSSTINQLLVHGQIDAAIDDIAAIISDIKKNIADFDSKKLNDYTETVRLYNGFNDAFRKSFDEMPEGTKEEKAEKESERIRINYWNDLLDEARNILNQRHYEIASQFMDEKSILDGGKVSGFLGSNFESMQNQNNSIIFTAGAMIAQAREKTKRVLLAEEEEINRINKAYVNWAKKQGLSGVSLYSPILNPKTGNLITPYSKEFHEVRKQMATLGREKFYGNEDYSKELEWMEEHYVFDEERWIKNKEKKEKELKLNKNFSEKDVASELEKLDKLNPALSKGGAYFVHRNFYLKFRPHTDPVMGKWHSEEWSFINKPENKPALDFYQMYIKFNQEMGNIVGWDVFQLNFVANIRANFMETAGRLGFMKEFTLWEQVQSMAEIRENDMHLGVMDQTTGETVRRIPVPFLEKIRGNVSFEEKQKIISELLAEGFTRDSIDYHNELDRRVSALQFEKGVSQKSTDLASSLKLMLRAAYDYKFKSEIEEDLLVLRHILTTKEYEETATDNFNEPVLDYISQTVFKRQSAHPSTVELFDKFVRLELYGQRLQSKDLAWTRGDRKYSTAKAIQAAQRYLSVKSLALNPILAGANHFNATVNKILVGKKGIYYTNNGWKDSVDSLVSGSEKDLMAIWFMEPTTRNMQGERALHSSASWMKKVFSMRTLFALHRGIFNKNMPKEVFKEFKEKGYLVDNPVFGDEMIANNILLAMMRSWVLDSDGKIKSKGNPLHKILNPEAKTLMELFNPDLIPEILEAAKGGKEVEKIPFEGLSFEEFSRFKRLVARAQNRVKGQGGEETQYLANTSLAGQVGMKFRDWMPGLITERYAPMRWDPLVESVEQGHHRGGFQELIPSFKMLQMEREANSTAVSTIALGWVLPAIKNLLSLGLEATSMGLYKHKINPERAEFYRLKFLEEHPELREKIDLEAFTTERFIKFREGQIRALATEVRYAVALLGAILAIMAAAGWDDDEEAGWFANNLYKLTKRTNLELDFFFSAQAVSDILKSPIPVWGVFRDLSANLGNFAIESAELIGLTEKNNRDRTPFGYYTLKQLPVVNQVLSLNNFFLTTQDKTTFEKIFQTSPIIQDLGSLRLE